jgi:hypothetical protein
MRLLVTAFTAGAIAGALAIGLAAIPERAAAQGVPSYGRPAPSTGEETIHGRIEAIQGPFAIVVRDDRGFLDSVALRQGTIINPRGLRLAVGMTVTIEGFNAGASFSAIEIDAPYSDDESGAANYDAYGYGYDYGLASGYDLGLGFIGAYGAFGGEGVQPVAPIASPKPGATRGIEHPTPGHPVRQPLDDQAGPAPDAQASAAPSAQASAAPAVSLPSYALPLMAGLPQFGAGSGAAIGGLRDRSGSTPQSRAPSPQSRGSAPEYHPAPAPARAESARSEPARSAPSPARSH